MRKRTEPPQKHYYPDCGHPVRRARRDEKGEWVPAEPCPECAKIKESG